MNYQKVTSSTPRDDEYVLCLWKHDVGEDTYNVARRIRIDKFVEWRGFSDGWAFKRPPDFFTRDYKMADDDDF